MCARASLATEYVHGQPGPGRTRIRTLRSEAPLLLRLTTRPKDHEPRAADRPGAARVCVAAGAAGPIGGDRYTLRIDVGPRSALILGEIAPTLLLPGPDDAESTTITHIHVGSEAVLVWLPEPVIAARGCRHVNQVRVVLHPRARLLMREELQLGRHGESPGRIRQRLRVERAGTALYDQEIRLGPDGEWRSSAVLGGHRAIGSALVVDPCWASNTPTGRLLADHVALLPLNGPALAVSALATDSLALRRGLDAGIAALGPFWPETPGEHSD